GSLGVPLVGNDWGACDPAEPRNRRLRPSILVEAGGATVLVDTTPDCRAQLLAAGVTRLDAVLYTHAHADHVHGMDDLRPLALRRGAPQPAYADAATLEMLELRFGYALASVDMDRGFYRPILTPHLIDGPFQIAGLTVVPFVQEHGYGHSLG